MTPLLQDYHCSCGKLMFKGLIINGVVEIKCRFCKRLNVIYGVGGGALGNARHVLFVGQDGKILRASSNAAEYLGYEAEENLRTLGVVDIFPDITDNTWREVWAGAERSEESLPLSLLQHHKSGARLPVSLETRFMNETEPHCVMLVVSRILAPAPQG